MKTLQILSLSHKAIERGGPAFSQHLHPLHVHLRNTAGHPILALFYRSEFLIRKMTKKKRSEEKSPLPFLSGLRVKSLRQPWPDLACSLEHRALSRHKMHQQELYPTE